MAKRCGCCASQSLELKYHYYDEKSNETYLGLTENDFENTPFFRYAASQEDVMNAEQQQYMLTHILNFTSNLKIVTNAYHNQFKRNWYKLGAVSFEDDKLGLATVVSSLKNFSNHMALLRGRLMLLRMRFG